MKGRAHGGDVFYASKVTGIPVDDIVDFSASINPLGMSGRALAAAGDALERLHHYPEPHAGSLAEKIAGLLSDGRKFKIRPAQVVPGNGSTELIYLLARSLRPKTVLVHNPTFSEYERAARLSGAAVRGVAGLSFRFARFADAMRGAQMAFLCNPNNPTGELLEKESVLELARVARKARCRLVVDEAFIDFCPGNSIVDEAARQNPYLVILRSMTKFHALTGLRVGYAVFGSGREAGKVLKFKEPWSVNTPAVEAAIAAPGDAEHAQKTLRFVEKERAFITRRLEKAGVWHFTGTPARQEGSGCRCGPNFFLIRLPEAQRFAARLFGKGVLVRDCSNFKGFRKKQFIRFAVKKRRENRLLLDEIDKWLGR
ncbi:MAG: pyridoxal phosphate-dependent class II aminotransferase [Nitrospiraceae bacterium]|nr:pyridoxal phosphate-dependent class II aminotransferase [Nitrospiraceae bacterium]